MSQKKTEISFEENIKELENIVKELESGEVSLEKMLSLFEEGVHRTKECAAQLEKAEQKITMMIKNSDGDMREQPFEAK